MDHFKAYRIFNENNKIEGRVSEITLDDVMPGEVVFKAAYSSVNYKDALAATGVGGKVIRKYIRWSAASMRRAWCCPPLTRALSRATK